jgi:hypothetical protein
MECRLLGKSLGTKGCEFVRDIMDSKLCND